MVEELALEHQDVAHACRVLKISRSGYYDWLNRPLSVRKTEDERLWQKIKKHWEMSRNTYGRLKITKKLKEEGEKIGKNRVRKIMKNHNIQGIGKKKFKPITTTSNHDLPIADRVFQTENAATQVTRPNQFWGGDITYIPTEEGWLYLSVFIDLFTRKVVGHSMRDTMHAAIATDAIDMALQRQGLADAKQLTTHSDRGSQYASQEYRDKLAAHGVTASMSRKGNCYDNAFVESFFRTKSNLFIEKNLKLRRTQKQQYLNLSRCGITGKDCTHHLTT